jgi:SAM-dependent methyltransferase
MFSDVDASGQAAEHAAYLDRAAGVFAARRHGWIAKLDLKAGQTVLDAGSGMGEVTQALSELVAPGGRAVGLDLSTELVARARQRASAIPHVEFEVGDVTALSFQSESFDAVYCERVFQHLADPEAAMGELFRVLRGGGRLVAIDPDFARSVIDADDVELSDLLTSAVRLSVANPTSGRQLRSRMVRAGFVDVILEATLLIMTDAAALRALSPRPPRARVDELVTSGKITSERADAYLADQDARETEGRFLSAVPHYSLSGLKPVRGA